MGKSWEESTSSAINIITECEGCFLYSDVIISLSAMSLHALGGIRRKPRVLYSMKGTGKYLACRISDSQGQEGKGWREEQKKSVILSFDKDCVPS